MRVERTAERSREPRPKEDSKWENHERKKREEQREKLDNSVCLLNFSWHVRKNVTRIASIFKGWVEFNEIATPHTLVVSRTVSQIQNLRTFPSPRVHSLVSYINLGISRWHRRNLNYATVERNNVCDWTKPAKCIIETSR